MLVHAAAARTRRVSRTPLILFVRIATATSLFCLLAGAPAASAETLWIADDTANRIYEVTFQGDLIRSFPQVRSADSCIEADFESDTLWSTAESKNRAVNFSKAGERPPACAGCAPELDLGALGLDDPEGIGVDLTDDTLWVVDDPDGLGAIPHVFNLTRDGALLASFPVSSFDPTSSSPQGIAVDPDGTLWLTDNHTDLIYHVTRTGDLIESFPVLRYASVPDPGLADPNPQGITVDGFNGTLWVTDRATSTIYNISSGRDGEPAGDLLFYFDSTSYDASSFNPSGVAYDGPLLFDPDPDPSTSCDTADTPGGWASRNGGTTGGAAGPTVTATTAAQFRNFAQQNGPLIIRVEGVLNHGGVRVASDKTILGVGSDAGLIGKLGINAHNVIVRNLSISNPSGAGGDDTIEVSGGTNVWIDHNNIFDGPDGTLDIVREADFVTVSWNRFFYTPSYANNVNTSHRFALLLGNSDSRTSDRGKLRVTLHHNHWGAFVKRRMPRVRYGDVHVFNEYFNSVDNARVIRADTEADVLVENNVFEEVNGPYEKTSSSARVEARGNLFINTTGGRDAGDNVFDPPYPYTLDDAQVVKSLVLAGAGPTCSQPDDTDGDGFHDGIDAFPHDPNEWADTDGDRTGDNADTDDDNDGQSDADELACGSDPLDPASRSLDTDGDGSANCIDNDDDNDGIDDSDDPYPDDPTTLWIADDTANRIYEVTFQGDLIRSFPQVRSADSCIEADFESDTLWGTAESKNRAVNFSKAGERPPTCAGCAPELDLGALGLEDPEGIAVDLADDTLWVVDDPDGLGAIPHVFNLTRDGALLASFPVSSFDPTSSSPQGIAVDPDGTLWFTDNHTDLIYHVTRTGDLIDSFPVYRYTSVFDPELLNPNPQGITVDGSNGTLWVTDRATSKIYNISSGRDGEPAGELLFSFDGTSYDVLSFDPTGVAYDGPLLFETNTPPPFAPILVNFQPSGSAVPSGYVADDGSAFGDRGAGLRYGWSSDDRGNSRDRGAHADQRYDTLLHFDKGGLSIWEIEIPNGSYRVDVVFGDPSYTDQVNDVRLENVTLLDPDGEDNFDEHTGIVVTVSDGRLTATPLASGDNAKIAFIEIRASE